MALRGLATRASQNPIEVIVSIFIVVTLAYFQLVHALATSNFFEPLSREASGLAARASSVGRPEQGGGSGSLSAAFWDPKPSTFAGTSIKHGTVLIRKAGQNEWTPISTTEELGDIQDENSKSLRFVVEPFAVADAQVQAAPILGNVATKLQEQLLSSSAISSEDANGKEIVQPFAVRDTDSGLVGFGFGRISEYSQNHWNERHQLLSKADDEDFLGSLINDSISESHQNTGTKQGKRASQTDADLQLLAIFPDADLRDFFSAQTNSNDVRTVRWMGYAVWALVMRFWALLKRADSADIFVMLSAYLLMHATFVNLFISMRRFGSNFWLGASVLTSSICAFLCALTMAYLLGVTVDPICLSEALPFLVITVGFEKPFLLTKAVFSHSAIAPQATTPNKAHPSLLLSALNESQQHVERQKQQEAGGATQNDFSTGKRSNVSKDAHITQEESFVRALTARLKSDSSLRWTAPQPVPAKEVVVAAVDAVGMQIVRDYAIEIAVMAVGATSGLSGLREFCQLAALILAFDCAFLFAFLVGTLTIMVEVHRIKVMRGMKRVVPSTPPNVDSDHTPNSDISPVDGTSSKASSRRGSSPDLLADSKRSRPLWRKAVKLLLGKVPFEPTRPGTRENPVARLKLLLVTTFLTLHSLNLVSTLTTQSAITRHHSTDGPTLYQSIQDSSRVLQTDAQSSLIAPLLSQLSKSQATDKDLFVKVYDPITFIVANPFDSPAQSQRSVFGEAALNASNGGQIGPDLTSSLGVRLGNSHAGITRSTNAGGSHSLNVLDSFMSGWTVIVGDPVISKWISLALVISIFLNAYLLKGIATGNAALAEGNAAGAAAFAAARMIGAHLNRQEDGVVTDSPLQRAMKPLQRDASVDRLSEYHRNLAKDAASHNKPNDIVINSIEKPVKRQSTTDTIRSPSSQDESNSTPQAVISINGISTDDSGEPRTLEEVIELYAEGAGILMLSDEEVILLVQKGKIAGYSLEKALQDHERAVRIRRATISRASTTKSLEHSLVPLAGYDYAQVMGACCENVVGFMPLPLGIAGPLLIDGQMTPIPMATTEGTLVASTSRGCKALNAAGGVTTVLTQDAMTRGPAVEFSTITQAAKAKRWIDSPDGAATMKEAFDSTSRFARLSSLRCVMAGRTLYIRFATSTGDAMGMNMVSKGVEKALACMGERFEMSVLSLSGNYCIDKKPSAINWIEGRGKSVCCEAVISGKTVKSVLKTSVEDLVNLNIKKNLIGSSMAASIGGFNAHAANIVAAVFLATGQDPAQVVESSMCMTLMEAIPSTSGVAGETDLLVTVSMPSIEVGTVGGGTILSPQRGLLEMLGVAGSSKDVPGANAQRLARIIAAAVMAGELSLMAALSAGHLIQAHMKHNRSVPPTPGNVTPTSSGSMSGGMFGLAFAQTPNSRSASETTGGAGATSGQRFQSSMTPLVAPPVGSGSQSRGSPVGTLSAKDRRSASMA
ncbi:hypothetical protein L7F22_044212 [Adiantum nelumboides]|nr:hypothetical protein [Adiantum nelumboides]